ncbi:KilA-N domain-containing protein [Pasteurella multocida]|uniref:KilA-N domain-containing protein n=1 Tax=Pasteurella multocida TaxID=747 RepID=UPI00287B2C67|nr:KilA-N domain-containing protein [Pasteurella multocida]HDX1086925.1 KilA-N domain-containing protein [Pasteurella multocida]
MTNLTILSNKIRTLDNLYSLNDLHRASGSDKNHQPAFFIRNAQTQELISEIERSANSQIAVKTVRGGRNPELQGSWACEELALAYATWISPKFHLVVLRAFIAMHKGDLQISQQNLPLVDVETEEEALHIIVNLFHSLNGAYEMGEKLRIKAPHLAKQIDNTIGGHYIYNLHMPTKQALEKARKFVHAKSERIMFVKGMLSLLEQPKQLRHTEF